MPFFTFLHLLPQMSFMLSISITPCWLSWSCHVLYYLGSWVACWCRLQRPQTSRCRLGPRGFHCHAVRVRNENFLGPVFCWAAEMSGWGPVSPCTFWGVCVSAITSPSYRCFWRSWFYSVTAFSFRFFRCNAFPLYILFLSLCLCEFSFCLAILFCSVSNSKCFFIMIFFQFVCLSLGVGDF